MVLRKLREYGAYTKLGVRTAIPGTKLAIQFGYFRMARLMVQSDKVAKNILDQDSLSYSDGELTFRFHNPPLSLVSCKAVKVLIDDVDVTDSLRLSVDGISGTVRASDISSDSPFHFGAGQGTRFHIPTDIHTPGRQIHVCVRFEPAYFGTRGHLSFRGKVGGGV